MSEIIIRPTDTFRAVHTSDSDWEDVLRGWLVAEGAPTEEVEGYMGKFREGVKAAGIARPWLINTPRGIAIVAPQDFVSQFEDVAATDVLGEVFSEQKRAIEKGFDATHDDKHTTADFVSILRHYADPLATPGNTLPDAVKRHEFIKVAQVAISAVHKIDRANDVRTFAV